MKFHEIWPAEDNKKIVDRRDSQYVSLEEAYEVRDFIEAFLDDAGKSHSQANKQAVLDAILSFKGRAPIVRVALKAHVQSVVRWPAASPKPR